MKVGIVSVVYFTVGRHIELADQTLQTIDRCSVDKEHIFVVNRSIPEGIEFLTKHYPTAQFLYQNPEQSVARCWNVGIKRAFESGCDLAFVPNLDIVLRNGALDRLVEFKQKHPEFLLATMVEHAKLETLNEEREIADTFSVNAGTHYSAYMVTKELIDKVGTFDENFKRAYFEDNDMAYRIILSGNAAAVTNTAQFYHYGSQTIANDETLRETNNHTFRENEAYYYRKWGGVPGAEVLKYPFNNPDKTWREW